MQRMAFTSSYDFADLTLGGTLAAKLTDWRAEGISLERIARKLQDEHSIDVSTPTVYRWCVAQGITKTEAAKA